MHVCVCATFETVATCLRCTSRGKMASGAGSAIVTPALSVAALVGVLAALGLSAARSLALLVLVQTLSILSLRAFSHEDRLDSPQSLTFLFASLALQVLPSDWLAALAMQAHPSAAIVTHALSFGASLALGALLRHALVRVPPARPGRQTHGMVVLLTGSSAGLGLETARQLLQMGATVVFACRSEARARAAMRAALAGVASGRPLTKAEQERAVFIPLDLCSLESVRECARLFSMRFRSLDALVCNAGAFFPERHVTPDGFEATYQGNHLGHMYLATLLQAFLRAGTPRGPCRVVCVSSAMHHTADSADTLAAATAADASSATADGERYTMFAAYARSKLAQVIYCAELHRREPSIVAVCLHPGNVATEVTRNFHVLLRLPYAALQASTARTSNLLRLSYPCLALSLTLALTFAHLLSTSFAFSYSRSSSSSNRRPPRARARPSTRSWGSRRG